MPSAETIVQERLKISETQRKGRNSGDPGSVTLFHSVFLQQEQIMYFAWKNHCVKCVNGTGSRDLQAVGSLGCTVRLLPFALSLCGPMNLFITSSLCNGLAREKGSQPP